MSWFGRYFVHVVVFALCSLAFMPGCDWLKASDMLERTSPYLTNLSISDSLVQCETEYSISFDYDDPQGDISHATVTLQLQGETESLLETFSWPDDLSRSEGSATFELSFDCDTTAGDWSIAVEVEDDVGHTSNILSGKVTLN